MKKIACICSIVAFVFVFVFAMVSCNKECVCSKKTTTYSDTLAADSTRPIVSQQEVLFHGGNIYDKKECSALNGETKSPTEKVIINCSMKKK